MNYEVNIKGFEGQNLEVKTSFWAAPKLLLKGETVARGGKRNEMILRRNDGQEVYALWKPQLFGMDVPQLIVDGKVVNVVPPLKWYEWIWSALPLILIAVGGGLGALIGVIAFSINLKIFRTELNDLMKFGAIGIVSILSGAIYLLVAIIFLAMAGQ